jgi:hypothetical protein
MKKQILGFGLFLTLGIFLGIPLQAQRSNDPIDDKFSAETFNNSFNQISNVLIEVSNELLKTNAINTQFFFLEDTVDIHREWFFHLTENIKNTSKMYTQQVIIYSEGKTHPIKIDTFYYQLDTTLLTGKTPKDRENELFQLRNEKVKEYLHKEKEKVFKFIKDFADKDYIDSVVYENYLIQSKRSYSKAVTIDMDKSFHLIYTVLKSRDFLTSLKGIRLAPNVFVRVSSINYPIDPKLYIPIKYIVHVNANRAKLSHTDTTFGQPSERLSISTNEILVSFNLDQRRVTYEQLAKHYIDECYKENSGRWSIIINKGEYKTSTSYAEFNKVSRKWTCGTIYTAKGKDPSPKDQENVVKMQGMLPSQ